MPSHSLSASKPSEQGDEVHTLQPDLKEGNKDLMNALISQFRHLQHFELRSKFLSLLRS
jgi:hypothetical protein